MRWETLGDFAAYSHGERLVFRGRRSLDVLAVLVLRQGTFVSMEQLVDELWPDNPPASARNSVQRFVSDIRNGLGANKERLFSSRAGYKIDLAGHELDIAMVEAQFNQALLPGTDRREAIQTLQGVAAALAERLCPGSETMKTVAAEARRLDTLRVHAIENAGALAAEAGLDLGDDQELWHSQYPYNERIAGQFMMSLAAAGRQRDALQVYEQVRIRLRDELGLYPGAEIKQIELGILQQQEHVAPMGASAAFTGAHDALIGRSELAAKVIDELRTHRLVTLTGMGGAGKTTLALHVAAVMTQGLESNALPMVARIEDATDRESVLELIAQGMGLVPSGPERPIEWVHDEIGRYLATQHCLVVIDNAEHVIDEVAEIARAVLATPGPGRILATSRERLAISAECMVRVPPLSLPAADIPAADSAAVQLFAARGTGLSDLDRSELLNHPASGTICTLVDGLPLAIELAAAQLAIFSPDELEKRLAASSRTLGSQRGAARHASLDHVVAWSWDLLDDAEQDLLAELSIYRSWTTATVEFLDAETGIGQLQSLVDKSLVATTDDGEMGRRFTLLETVREFAFRQLDASKNLARANDRQADWLIELATSQSIVETMVDASATTRLFHERVNLIRAIEWLRSSVDTDRLVTLLTYSAGSFAHHGPALEIGGYYSETLPDARARFEHGTLSADALGALLTATADVFHAIGDLEGMITVASEAVSLAAAEPYDWAPAANATFAVVLETATLDGTSLSLLERAEALAPRTESSSLNQAQVAIWRGMVEMMNRRFDSALQSFRRALEIDPRPGRVLLLAETGMATTLFLQQRFTEAHAVSQSMKSDPSTDVWHYLVDVISAIAIGGVDPRAGAQRLEASLGPSGESDFIGYADDARIATGILAFHSGNQELCRRMLAGRMGRSPLQVCLLMEYLDGEPDPMIGQREWRKRWKTAMEEYFDGVQEPEDSWVVNLVQEITVDHVLAQLGLPERR